MTQTAARVPAEVRIVATRRPPREGQGGEYLTMQEAAALLGVSRYQVSRLVTRLGLRVYERPADRRIKLLRREDVETALRPRPREGA